MTRADGRAMEDRDVKLLAWTLVLCAGFGLMLWSHYGLGTLDASAPCRDGRIILGVDASAAPEGTTAVPATVRLLPMRRFAEAMVSQGGLRARQRNGIRAYCSELVLRASPEALGLTSDLLASGRLPAPGADEVLAGGQATHTDTLRIAGRKMTVTGVLWPDAALLAHAYLVPPDPSVADLFAPGDAAVQRAAVVPMTPDEARDKDILKALGKAWPPKERFTTVAPYLRSEQHRFWLYLAGMAMMLVGGSGLLIGAWRALAGCRLWRSLGDPLAEMQRRRGLLWGVHLAYFGAVVVAAAVVYGLPEVQAFLMAIIKASIQSGQGPLALAGKAYGSGNVAYAAAVTFGVNFGVGSLLSITVPSMILPGSGALVALFRAVMWGGLLGPSTVDMAALMLPHSWTLLLEGEAYILATFFALLIPIHLFDGRLGSFGRRLGRALLLNLEGCILVAIVLGVAAVYEAIEVIAQM